MPMSKSAEVHLYQQQINWIHRQVMTAVFRCRFYNRWHKRSMWKPKWQNNQGIWTYSVNLLRCSEWCLYVYKTMTRKWMCDAVKATLWHSKPLATSLHRGQTLRKLDQLEIFGRNANKYQNKIQEKVKRKLNSESTCNRSVQNPSSGFRLKT
jgi:hypothetical protein